MRKAILYPVLGYTALTHAGTSGTVHYAVVNGMVHIRVEASYPSTAAAATFTLVTAANGLPAAIRPTIGVQRGRFTSGTVIGRIDVNTDGSIAVIPLTGTTTAANGSVVFPAGL